MGKRHVRHTHAIRVPNGDVTDTKGIGGASWCGEDYAYNTLMDWKEGEDKLAFSRRMTNCPKCSAAIGKARLAQLAGRVTLESVPVPQGRYGSYYRTAWRIDIDGQPVGHAVMKNGWGNSWELKDLTAEDRHGEDFGSTVSYEPSIHYPAKPDDIFQRVHFASKEAMASAAFRCRDKGSYLYLPEERREMGRQEKMRRDADEAERKANRERLEAERQQRAAAYAEKKQLALDAIASVLERPDLSNLERAGLENAKDILSARNTVI